jgi:DNA-binding NtrC family response regulator
VKRILVVDNEPPLSSALRRWLSREGFYVEVASSGEEALSVLEPAAPDLVLTDFEMDGMNGLQLLREVQKRRPETGGIILSAHAQLKWLGDEAERFPLQSKPWNEADLLSVIRRLLDEESG